MGVNSASLWVRPEVECRELLAGAPVGRAAVCLDAARGVLTMKYVLIGGQAYFPPAASPKLAAAINSTVVAFQDDPFDAAGSRGWSVLDAGTARVVADPDGQTRLTRLGAHCCGGAADAHYVAIGIGRISGSRILSDRPRVAGGRHRVTATIAAQTAVTEWDAP